MEIAVLSVIILAIMALDVPPLIKSKKWRELGVFSLLLLIGAGLSISMIMDITFLNPVKILESVFSPVGKWIAQIFS